MGSSLYLLKLSLIREQLTVCFPSDTVESIGATVEENRTFELADGRVVELPLGYVAIRIDGKQIIAPAVFGPEAASPLLGATALEISGLAVDPIRQILVPVNAHLMSGFITEILGTARQKAAFLEHQSGIDYTDIAPADL